MPNKFVPKLTDVVAETLLIPLYMKAQLTTQNSPIIKDDSAVTLVNQIDYDFEQFQQSDMSLIGCGVRADYFDKYACHYIHNTVSNKQALAIISLGCGLDDRYRRIAEQSKLDTINSPHIHFFDIDLPEVMALRTQLLPAQPNQSYIAGSLFENDWLIEILDKIKQLQRWQGLTINFCFMIEGVLMYFETETVNNFFVNVADMLSQYSSELSSIGDINFIFDTISLLGVKFADKHDTVSKVEATFKWGVEDDKIVSQWDSRYQLQLSTFIMMLHPKLWSLKARLIRLIPPIRNTSKILTYRLTL